jgi:formiminotetrahydrofolate cyclodeaminase
VRRHHANARAGQDARGGEHRHRRRGQDGGALLIPAEDQPALAQLPLSELLDRLAADTPAPGGGSASAVVCALAAGLVEMAAKLGGKRVPPHAAGRARELRGRALALAQTDLGAYELILAALRLPASDPARAERLEQAVAQASQPPLAIAQVGAELADLAVQVARGSRPHPAGDATAAALLAEAGCRAATILVSINLKDAADRAPVHRAADLARKATSAREHAVAKYGQREPSSD